MKFNFSFYSHRYFLGAILLLAFVLRLFHLDFQSLWLDEIYTMNMANPDNSFSEIYTLSQTTDPLSVLYFFLMKIFFKVLGYSSWTVRFFSLLFGILGICFIYLLGKELRNKTTGRIAALLLSVNYFHIFYSQEARVYSMFSAFTCLSFYFLVRYIKNPGKQTSIYYGLSALLMVLSHFFGLFTLVAQVLLIVMSAFFVKGISFKKYFLQSLVPALIVIIGFIPIIPIFLILTKNTSTWIPPILNTAFSSLFYNFFGDSYMLVSLAGLFIIYYVFSVFREEPSESTEDSIFKCLVPVFCLLAVWVLVTFFIPYVQSFRKFPILNSRYMISFLPAILLMLAIGFDLIRNSFLKIGMVLLFVFVSLVELVYVKAYYTTATKSHFRESSRFVVDNNFFLAKICTSLPYHFDYYFKLYKNKARIDSSPLNALMDEQRKAQKKPEAFWLVDAHNRKLELSDSNTRYFNDHYEVLMKYEGFDAWAKLFAPRPVFDTLTNYLSLNALNFFEKIPYLNDLNLYLNSNGTLESRALELGQGNHRCVIKSRSMPVIPINNIAGHLNVYANDSLIGSFFVRPQSFIEGDTLAFNSKIKQTVKLKIEFDNDTTQGLLDRNVIIREVNVISQK